MTLIGFLVAAQGFMFMLYWINSYCKTPDCILESNMVISMKGQIVFWDKTSFHITSWANMHKKNLLVFTENQVGWMSAQKHVFLFTTFPLCAHSTSWCHSLHVELARAGVILVLLWYNTVRPLRPDKRSRQYVSAAKGSNQIRKTGFFLDFFS